MQGKDKNNDKGIEGKEIEGVIIKKLKLWEDARGWLSEIHRSDESPLKPAMAYVSHTNFLQSRGPHEHAQQTDFFVFLGYGDFELYLWDNRKTSKTYRNRIKMIVGASNKVSVLVPPGIVHGYKAVTKQGALSINLPDRLYAGEGRKEKVDEIRHEEQESPFKIS